jgi:outer membrane protein OmpA-like peptidoglycan-associated protein
MTRRRGCHQPPLNGIVRFMPQLTPRLLLPMCLALAPVGMARAQVTVDLHALDAPPGTGSNPPQAPAPSHKPVPHRAVPHHATAKPAPKSTAPQEATKPEAKPPAAATATAPPAPAKPIPPAAATPPAPPAAVVGTAPPPAPVIPPPPAPDAPMAPEAPPTISTTAKTIVEPLPKKEGDGVRLDFASGETDLTQGTADAVKALVAAAPKADSTTFNVMAYATGVPEDPSTARRLSLSRALSVRSALIAYGVPSTHIYVRAMGAPTGTQTTEGPADRVDVLVMGANASATPAGTATP